MPAFWAMMLMSSHLVLVADRMPNSGVPVLDVKPSCAAAAANAVGTNRNESVCLRDENQARAKLKQDWHQFSREDQRRCTSLSQAGGSPSYVELLTCLELAKQAASLSGDPLKVDGKVQR